MRPPTNLDHPHIRLHGDVGPEMLDRFLDQLKEAGDADPLVVEMTTLGGDAETGRRLALELRGLVASGRRVVFLGKTAVYSAGVTMMAATPVRDRWITPDTVLLVHCRKLEKTVELNEALRLARDKLEGLIRQIDVGLELQKEGFEELARGSKLTADEVAERATHEWYVQAREALDHGLVGGIWEPSRRNEGREAA